MKRVLPFLVCSVICVFMVGRPALAADREHQQMMADIRMLQEQANRLYLMLGSLDQTLQILLSRLDEQDEANRRAFADQRLLVDNLSGGVRVVREKADETNVRVSSLAQEVEALRLAIPPMTPQVTQLPIDPETGLPTAAASPVPAPAAVAPVNPGVSPQRMYDQAWADYTTGQWALAVQGFEAYISTFPRSELADDAQFYIGQTHYTDGRYREAASAFEQVVMNYPDGDAVAEALYKRGLALDRLGESELARQAFEQVVRNHPDHNMSNLAQQALDRLGQSQ